MDHSADVPKDRAWLWQRKALKAPVTMVTCYDFPTACALEAAGIDVVFVGDSLATNVLGLPHQNDLAVAEIRHHLRAVARGITRAYLLADIPHACCGSVAARVDAAAQLRADGAVGVKFEGFDPAAVEALTASGADVWGHLGYTPQLMDKPGLQARDLASARRLAAQAEELCNAGLAGLVLELVPEEVAAEIAARVAPPVIGIGAGRYCDGQVQVWHDLVGLTPKAYRHAARLRNWYDDSRAALEEFAARVARRQVPAPENVTHASAEVQADLRLGDGGAAQ